MPLSAMGGIQTGLNSGAFNAAGGKGKDPNSKMHINNVGSGVASGMPGTVPGTA